MFKVAITLAALVAVAFASCATDIADSAQTYASCGTSAGADQTKVCECVSAYVKGLEGASGCSDMEKTAITTVLNGLNASGFLDTCNITLSSAAATTFSVVAAAVAAVFML